MKRKLTLALSVLLLFASLTIPAIAADIGFFSVPVYYGTWAKEIYNVDTDKEIRSKGNMDDELSAQSIDKVTAYMSRESIMEVVKLAFYFWDNNVFYTDEQKDVVRLKALSFFSAIEGGNLLKLSDDEVDATTKKAIDILLKATSLSDDQYDKVWNGEYVQFFTSDKGTYYMHYEYHSVYMIYFVPDGQPALGKDIKEAKTEILFRDCPWECSFSEVEKSFPDKIYFSSLYGDKAYEVEARLFRDENAKKYDAEVGCYCSSSDYFLNKISFRIAGYPVYDMDLRFAYVPEDNGIINHDNPKTALYYAQYDIKPNDVRVVYNDLKTKLSALYGEYQEVYSASPGESDELTYISWYGNNDTAVTLVLYGKENKVQIEYGYLKGNALLERAYEALLYEERVTDSNNYDGL